MRSLLAGLTAGLLATTTITPASADVVVELFTSQGCNSCPPADALLGQLTKEEGVIALSLHVDYWDYLGWKDKFAKAAFTQRQRRYAAIAGATMIYTPQMIIGGTDSVVGTDGMRLANLIMKHREAAADITLAGQRAGATISLRADGQQGHDRPLIVQLVQFSPTETVEIHAGENIGREITYHNVVHAWETVAQWDGKSPLSLDAEAAPEMNIAVIVQDEVSGAIVAAAQID